MQRELGGIIHFYIQAIGVQMTLTQTILEVGSDDGMQGWQFISTGLGMVCGYDMGGTFSMIQRGISPMNSEQFYHGFYKTKKQWPTISDIPETTGHHHPRIPIHHDLKTKPDQYPIVPQPKSKPSGHTFSMKVCHHMAKLQRICCAAFEISSTGPEQECEGSSGIR